MKYFVLSSSGSTMKIADLELQNASVSIVLSKHRICSISESRNAFNLDIAVERTEAMACSAVLSAAPANHFALWSAGSFCMSSWNWFFPFTGDGANRSWINLNTLTI